MASAEDVKKLAALARIAIPEEKLASLKSEFDGILAYVGKLDELTLPSSNERPRPAVRNVLRPDGEPHEGAKYTEKLAEQFPERDGDYLKVKQIISYD